MFLASGHASARLAHDFRVLGEARRHVGLAALVLQVPVLVAWALARPVSLASYSACATLSGRL